MSLILDALRKMEQERKSRRGAAVDLRPEVLRYRGEMKPKQGKPYLLMALLAVVLIAAGGGAGFLVKGKLGGAKPESIAAAPSIPAQAVVVAEPAPPSPASGAAPISAPISAAVAVPAAAPATPAPATHAAGPSTEAQTVSAAAAPPLRASVKPVRRAVAVATPSTSAPATPSARRRSRPQPSPELQGSIPDITVSGIAWQDERSLRRAVLNGTLVAEGAEVAGARVVEIKENRVRLSRGGQIFDVLFSSGLSSH